MKYCAFDRVLDSDWPFPELPRASRPGPPSFIVSSRRRIVHPPGLRWSVVWPAADGQPELAFARRAATVFLRMRGRLSAAIRGRRIAVHAGAAMAPATVRHILLDQVLPLALAAAGETVLHASAVGVDGVAVLLVGEARSGKSTTAAALAGAGAAVLADDGVLLDSRGSGVWAVPSYPGLRLWPDAAGFAVSRGLTRAPVAPGSEKRRLLLPGGAPPPVLPLGVVYSLRAGGPSGISKLSRRDATLELVRHAFTPDVASRPAILAHLDRATGLSGCIEVWSATAPRGLEALESFAEALLAHARSRPASVRLQDRCYE